MLLQPLVMHLSHLLRLIVGQYFSGFSSILIVYNNSGSTTPLQLDYLSALQLVLRDLRQPIRLQWINVALFKDLTALEDQVMGALNSSVTEGFITILSQTNHFLHARYYATRNANVRLKDKRYLFLCEDENPAELLSMDILQLFLSNSIVFNQASQHQFISLSGDFSPLPWGRGKTSRTGKVSFAAPTREDFRVNMVGKEPQDIRGQLIKLSTCQ